MDYEICVNTEIIKQDRNTSVRSLLYTFSRDVSSKNFKLQITDPDDPLFLYDYELSSAKYQEVKREQYLSCEFINFPQNFYELLKKNNQEPQTRKVVIDEKSNPLLMLQQNTDFRLLIYLSIQINSASDSRLKEFLSREAKKYKNMYQEAIKITEETKKLQITEKEKLDLQISELQTHIKLEQQKYETEKQQIEAAANSKIQQYEAALIQTKQSLGQGYSTREQSLSEKYEKKIEELRQKNISLIQEKHNAELNSQRHYEKIQNQEQKIVESTAKIQELEEINRSNMKKLIEQDKESTLLQKEVQSLREKMNYMQHTLEEKASIASTQGITVESLQAELFSKNAEIDKMTKELGRLSEVERYNQYICQKVKNIVEVNKKQVDRMKSYCREKDEINTQLTQKIEKYNIFAHYKEEQYNSVLNELQKEKESSQTLRDENVRLQEKNESLKSELKSSEETRRMIEDQLNRKHKLEIINDDDTDLLASDDEDEKNTLNVCDKKISGREFNQRKENYVFY